MSETVVSKEENMEEQQNNVKPKKWSKEYFLHEGWSWIYIFFIVFGFRSTFIDHYHIPSGSLLPTNAIGDSIVVNKMSYGFKLPFSEFFGTYSRALGLEKEWAPVYLTEQTLPTRGDIVVFEFPKDKSILFVKRCIAVAGDTVEMYDNDLYINGKKIERSAVTEDAKYRELFDEKPGQDPSKMVFFKQSLEGKDFITAQDSRVRPFTMEKVTVPEDHIFVLGDNRDYSADSRYWGFVHKDLIRGRAFTVWMSMVYPWSSEPFHFRPSRIGTML